VNLTDADYLAIAKTLKRARAVNDTRGHQAGTADCIIMLSYTFKDRQPGFDRAEFVRACGLTYHGKD
jgi:hypothetical protein